MIGTGLELISKALLVVASLLAFFLCFVVVTDVLGRVLFNTPLQGTPEMVSSSIVIICFLQAGYAILSGGMMQVEVVLARLSVRWRALFTIMSCVMGMLLFGIIVWGSIEGLAYSWSSGEYEGEGALRVPMWPVRLAVLFGSALAVLAYLLLAARQIDAARRNETQPIGSSH